MYFDEDLILNLRFNILNEYVDNFIIVEATRDHAGNHKKLNFDIKKFPDFKKKIIYIVVDDIPEVVKSYKKGWSPNFFRENFHRNAISRALTECSGNDLIIISDADEIPNLDIMKNIKIKRFAIFDQKNFLYKINLLNSHHWLGSSICYKKYLKSPQWLRNKRFLRRGFLRKIFFKTQILEKGGWHFSFLKSPEDKSKKMKAYSHGEYQNFTDVNLIKKSIVSKSFFISPEKKLIKVSIDKSFPKFIRDNRESLSEWIL
jgi:beta-1,4-mannosyl-glycoprotein beta-1,4-N-acetylglucosaminyltransferase